ncbi:alginate export family protein [Myxococcota bacterium]|jgi:hypothetical protein|nr:alginate export family protein [Myxococcota bacterium]
MTSALLLFFPALWAAEPAATPAAAPDPAPAAAPAPKPIEISGAYTAWALNQRNFFLGDPAQPYDDGDYVVQNLRVLVKFNQEHFGVVTRFDAAQGWWGVDNSPDVEQTTTVAEDGTVTTASTYNPYKLFRDKDTNYTVHFDLAYAWAEVPNLPVKVMVGRQFYWVGQGLVLDQNADGVQVLITPMKPLNIDLWWAKLSEGEGSTKAPTGTLMSDADTMADADLFGGRVRVAPNDHLKGELYGLYYLDNSGGGSATYVPNGLGHNLARFRPNISSALALGAAGSGTAPVLGGLSWAAEAAWLQGQDDVANLDSAGGTLDINNGQLKGWVAYALADQTLGEALPVSVGAAFGAGSGDADRAGGDGNLNKIMTMGQFNFTNVWEDSVMPDQEGISPQGLGSPLSRGYREFENTIAVQGRLGVKPHDKVKLLATYTFLQATTPIQGWDATGALTDAQSSSLGQEVDFNLDWNVWKGFSYQAQTGVFLPGDAAGLLILGHSNNLAPAWEIKQVVTAKF